VRPPPSSEDGGLASGFRGSASPRRVEIDRIIARKRRLGIALAILGGIALAILILRGWRYYLLAPPARIDDPQNRLLRPSGGWGHGVGIAATLVMLANFLYPMRKRARWMAQMGPVPLWLTFHVFVGIMSPVVILFHAAFRFNNLIATLTYGSLVIVVTTGLIGRYIYAMVPGAGERDRVALADLQRSWADLHTEVNREIGERRRPPWLETLLDSPAMPRDASAAGALRAVLAWPIMTLRARSGARRIASGLSTGSAAALRTDVERMVRLRLQIEFFGGIKRLLTTWRSGHALLAVFLVLVIVIHVAVSLTFGYRWIF
jgi:hypothetical protein